MTKKKVEAEKPATVDSLFTADAHEEGAPMKVVDPNTGKLHGLVLHLVGCDSDTFRHAEIDMHKARISAGVIDLSTEEAHDEVVEKVVKCTKGWDAPCGEKFTKSEVRKLYRKSPPVYNQAIQFMEERKNFYRD